MMLEYVRTGDEILPAVDYTKEQKTLPEEEPEIIYAVPARWVSETIETLDRGKTKKSAAELSRDLAFWKLWALSMTFFFFLFLLSGFLNGIGWKL